MARRIFDRVYGEIYLSERSSELLNTRALQRLDAVRQLGGCSFVYPSASHTRLEHSIGVAHLAATMGRHLRGLCDVTDDDIVCLEVAGLLHDVGHGPFSHLFEEYVREHVDAAWSHEAMSERVIRDLLTDRMTAREVELVLSMVSGRDVGDGAVLSPERRVLLEVVHNCTCGIDVDRLDYLLRDSLCVFGATHSIDVSRIVSGARAIRGVDGARVLAFDQSVALSIEQIFDLRTRLHRQLYQHRDVLLVEDFIKDGLQRNHDRVVASLSDVDAFLGLTDATVLDWMTDTERQRLYAHPRGRRVPLYANSIDMRPRCLQCSTPTDVEDRFCGRCGCALDEAGNRDFVRVSVDGVDARAPVAVGVTGHELTVLMRHLFGRTDVRVLLSDVHIGTPRVRNGWVRYGVLSEVVFCDASLARVALHDQMPRVCHRQRSVYCFVCGDADDATLAHMAAVLSQIVERIDGKKM